MSSSLNQRLLALVHSNARARRTSRISQTTSPLHKDQVVPGPDVTTPHLTLPISRYCLCRRVACIESVTNKRVCLGLHVALDERRNRFSTVHTLPTRTTATTYVCVALFDHITSDRPHDHCRSWPNTLCHWGVKMRSLGRRCVAQAAALPARAPSLAPLSSTTPRLSQPNSSGIWGREVM